MASLRKVFGLEFGVQAVEVGIAGFGGVAETLVFDLVEWIFFEKIYANNLVFEMLLFVFEAE